MRSNRTRQKFSVSGVVFFAFLLFFLVVMGLSVAIFVNVRFGKFSEAERVNLAIDGSSHLAVSVSADGKDAVVVYFPDNLYISDVAFGYGQYPISRVYQVGELDKRGGQAYLETIGEVLGIPMDGFVHDGRKFAGLRQFFLNTDFIFTGISNLNFWDRVRLAQIVWKVRPDRVKEVDLSKIAEKMKLSDGSKMLALDSESVDNKLNSYFSEEGISGGHLRVEVVNLTNVDGLGERTARILGNIGVNVVSVDSQPSKLKKCAVFVREKLRRSLTVRRIAAIFNCTVNADENLIKSDLVVKIGADFAGKL